MSDFGWYDGAQKVSNVGGNAGASSGTSVSAPGSTNTKGSYTQLIASTAHAASGMVVTLYFTGSSGAVHGLVDIAVGGAGSEVVIIPDLHISRQSSNNYATAPILLPCRVPAGTRISARFQSSQTSTSCSVSIALLGEGEKYPIRASKVIAAGVNSGTSKGTTVDPGGSAHTKGSYAQLTASTTVAGRWCVLTVAQDSSASSGTWQMDLAVGGAGSEQIIVPDLNVAADDVGLGVLRVFLPVAIPLGSRVAARCRSNITTAGARELITSLHIAG